MKDIMFTASGIISWGDTWEWTFDGGVELKAPDGHTLLVTDLHTQDADYHFEDDLFDRDFSMSPAQDAEWGQICWDCYLLESMIYGMARDSFKSCASQLVQDFKAKNMDVTDTEYDEMYVACLEAIKEQQGWGSEGLGWLFSYDGPMSVAVDDWLMDFLEEHELRVTY